MKIGVYNHKSIVDFSGVMDYLEGLTKEYKESYEKKRKRRIPRSIFEGKLSRFNEALGQLNESWYDESFFEKLIGAFAVSASLDQCPEEIVNLFYREREVQLPSGRKRKIRLRRRIPAIFDSRIIPEVMDVVLVEKEHISGKKWLFDVITIKESGLSFFKKVLHCFPSIKKGMEILKERKHFSSRHTFRPYPLATKLWLRDNASIAVPSDLKSFLQGAIRYIFSGEWRTSIVLSAITVESVLADLFEEEYKEPTPDVPLGDLFRRVKEKISFPPDIVRAIEMTNEARIAAVHRSRFPVSDMEAINALFGATNFTLWYSS